MDYQRFVGLSTYEDNCLDNMVEMVRQYQRRTEQGGISVNEERIILNMKKAAVLITAV